MRTVDMMIWSAEAGSMGLIVLLALAEAAYIRSRATVNALAYLAAVWLCVTLLSGLPAAIFPQVPAVWFHTLQVLAGPLCAGIGCYGVSLWLSADQRDRLTTVSLRTATLVCLAGGPLCLLAGPAYQLPLSASLTVPTLCLSLWLTVRAAQLGDRMAWGLAAGSALTLPLQLGLYWVALGNTRPSATWQALIALTGLISMTVTATMVWLRNRRQRALHHDTQSRSDPITQLYSSVVIVQKIIRAQRRLVRTRRDGALMAVMIFEPEALLPQVGQYGLNDIYIQLARRMQRHTGVVNPAGRYYDRCFIVLMETMHSPRWIRTMGLRVASALRRPIEVTSLSGDRIRVTADIAVGIVHLSGAAKDVDQVLHEAQSVAVAARAMRSRAALLDPENRHAVPVESAELGNSWRAQRAHISRWPTHHRSEHAPLAPTKPGKAAKPIKTVRYRSNPV